MNIHKSVLAMAISLLSSPLALAAEVGQPNVVFIFADDMGYGDVSAYDKASKIKTPNLDRLASAGMMFTDAHTASGVCSPSRYALLTGRYSWRTRLKAGVLHGYSFPLIDDGRLTLASLMKQKGYSTGCFGKWHLGMEWRDEAGKRLSDDRNRVGANVDHTQRLSHTPTSLGFDTFYGIAASLDMPPYVWIENDRVVEQPKKGYQANGGRKGPTADGWKHEHVMPRIGDRAIEFIRENKSKPFFAYVPLNAPHTPHAPSEAFVGKSGLDVYGDFMLEVDHTIGRIVRELDRCELTENTLVIVTSDNGPETNMYARRRKIGHDSSSRLLGAKRDNWEGGQRVPFIVRWPAVVKAGSQCDSPIGVIDVMATLAEITGQPLADNAGSDSFSFLSLLEGVRPNGSRVQHAWIHHSSKGRFAIRQGNWKLLLHAGSGGNAYTSTRSRAAKGSPEVLAESFTNTRQLFDLEADVEESKNLADEHPEMVARLTRLASEIVTSGRSTAGKRLPYFTEPWAQLDWLESVETSKE